MPPHSQTGREGFSAYSDRLIEMPPKAFNNLRASRATELAEQFPGHVAAKWLGHTEEIANAHYRQVLPVHFEKALTSQIVMPKMMPPDAVLICTDLHASKQRMTQVVSVQEETAACENMQPFNLEAGGIRNFYRATFLLTL